MAEGGEVSGRRDDLIKNCAPCSDKGTERTAVNYCFKCETFFCQDCTEHHNAFLSKHRVTEIESTNVAVSMNLHAESCSQHGRPLKFYCKEHDTVCCDECIDIEHISCSEVVYLPRSAQDAIKDIDVTEIKSKLRRAIEQLEAIKINQQATVTSLGTDRGNCLKEIDDNYAELLDLLAKIVHSSKDKVEQTYERLSADLQRHQQEVEKCLVDLESSEKRLERNQGNGFQLFMYLKKCQNQLKATDDVSTDSLENLKVRGFSVTVDDRLHNHLGELESLVTVVNKAPVKVKKKYQINLLGNGGKYANCIYGFCMLNDGSILLADFNNKIMKCIDHDSLKVKDQCPMQGHPNDVCLIDNSEVAVTQHNKTLTIVSVRPRLTPTRTISMNHYSAYVAYFQGELFITDEGKSLYIYNMEGSLLRKITTDPSGQDIFSRTRHVMVSAASDRVYIADEDNGLIIIHREGRFQDKLVNVKIRGAFGLCLDEIGGLFVCGLHSNNVVHVGADGQILTEVLTSSDGLMKPLSMCYDRLHKRLIVTKLDSNQIHVCELE